MEMITAIMCKQNKKNEKTYCAVNSFHPISEKMNYLSILEILDFLQFKKELLLLLSNI